ncbi:phage baseplate assembly protein V [Avibacterium avium]|uniref:phage baseplate assembly protein V n=1 Tax=Avibacterium avium TaxID=751 RepID=UPI003BF8BC30
MQPPKIEYGEQCVILAPSGELSTGFILSGIYRLEFDTPSNSPDEHVIEFADGARIEYNQASSALKISGINTALVQASTSISEQDLVVAESIFKAIDKYGLEGARVQIGFERAKRNLLLAHQRMSELRTNKEE